ncbi:MAG: UvrD-helicase domain-containing protein [Alphaproteobacteria bacterium]|nr:UvrD-helicase domain-containing protein [Alphaproteobacteria bacterium]
MAGAGTGKTTVLINRLRHLIEDRDIAGYRLVAMTFTNKASLEMKDRLFNMVGEEKGKTVQLGTFHGLCWRWIIGYRIKKNLSKCILIDDNEQLKLVKEIVRPDNKDKLIDYKEVLESIQRFKDNLYDIQNLPTDFKDPSFGNFKTIYLSYQSKLKELNGLDFGDILLYMLKILEEDKEYGSYMRNRFHSILVDEFQDTNRSQYKLIRCLTKPPYNLFCVGDDDQLIYQWRGANIDNIRGLPKEFKELTTIKLEENYRSTPNILGTANRVICNNKNRFEKKLYASGYKGKICSKVMENRSSDLNYESSIGDVIHRQLDNDYDEAHHIVQDIVNAIKNGYSYSQIAILIRSSTIGSKIEEKLHLFSIPFRVVGGKKFFEYKDIQDLISYIKISHSPTHNLALSRSLQTPKRGCGTAYIEKLKQISYEDGTTLLESIPKAGKRPKAVEYYEMIKSFNEISSSVGLCGSAGESSETLTLPIFIRNLYEASGLKNIIDNSTENRESRQGRIESFIDLSNRFNNLDTFLDYLTLVSGIDSADDVDGRVSLMTIHSSKGLEFDIVFLAGLEEGILPTFNSINDGGDKLEEERRITYVGITRAKKKLVLSCCRERFVHGKVVRNAPSRFYIESLPPIVSLTDTNIKKPKKQKKHRNFNKLEKSLTTENSLQGKIIKHKSFGTGVVIKEDESDLLTVAFKNGVVKKIEKNEIQN